MIGRITHSDWTIEARIREIARYREWARQDAEAAAQARDSGNPSYHLALSASSAYFAAIAYEKYCKFLTLNA